ncbi:MAG: Spo0E family sporulation regulatory protein-aspartic acid phosphatase [Clostridia bacterium]|nr:Spo0E family sporulation regulatory protein-aspartic acid phosphatase [Clostridia bacterium]MDD4375290.1 Spo0E family sporulation regulatory protein-aspartic acid phosphatase [Clostridia bacterium]
MVIEEINKLRDRLEQQIAENKSYTDIYNTSIKIDKLITQYYKEKGLVQKS